MIRELINKLKSKKQQLQKYNTNNDNDDIVIKPIEEEKEINIKISKHDNIYKIEIDDYISIGDYIKKMKLSDEYRILDFLCNGVIWNSNKQKVNKGIYYVITNDNRIYNILFTDTEIKLDERTKKEFDEQTQKENITEERIITIDSNKNRYSYFSAKHDKTGNTYYVRYYYQNRQFSLGELDLTEEETYEGINLVISNLEAINGITNIIDIELLKEQILKDLIKNLHQRKKQL